MSCHSRSQNKQANNHIKTQMFPRQSGETAGKKKLWSWWNKSIKTTTNWSVWGRNSQAIVANESTHQYFQDQSRSVEREHFVNHAPLTVDCMASYEQTPPSHQSRCNCHTEWNKTRVSEWVDGTELTNRLLRVSCEFGAAEELARIEFTLHSCLDVSSIWSK